MVSVFFGDDKRAVLLVDSYFDFSFEPEWFNDPFVKEMVKVQFYL